jgi:uncharacterized protein (TIGR04255 family)
LKVPPVPRCWFLNSEGSELIQLQQDRFIANWRKVSPNHEYPRYERVRQLFEQNFEVFRQFVAKEQLGEITATQCEVSYVNHIRSGQGWSQPGELGTVLTVWNSHYTDDFLSAPEDVRLAIRYLIKDDAGDIVGRLHISMEPKYSASDGSLMFVMVFTARGKPKGKDLESMLRFFDLGRQWIVRGFASITTEDPMQKLWGRHDKR